LSIYKLVARTPTGKKLQIDPDTLGGANVVIPSVPCEASVFVGAAVIMQGSGIAKNGLADSLANSNIIGIVESKATSIICNIRVLGVSGSLFVGLDVTKEYYLSESVVGGISTLPPVSSGSVILKIGQPYSATEMLVNKGQRTVRV
jgi:hypothetical protein